MKASKRFFKNIFVCLFLSCFFFFYENIGLAADSDDIASFTPEMLYPSAFKSDDMLLWSNIKEELEHRLKFLKGRRPIKLYIVCHKFQRLMSRAVDRAAKEDKLPFTEINNEVLFGDNSEITKIITPQPTLKLKSCNYHSFGDISKGCVLYCDAHGVDFESDFYKKHRKKLEASRPFINAGDVAEFIVFSPTLVFPFIAFFILRRKNKVKTN